VETLAFVLLLFGMTIFYFLPVIIAAVRHTEHTLAIEWIDFLFGWTIFGWIAAMIWAAVDKPADQAGR
jgi:T4 superinfection immunity protein